MREIYGFLRLASRLANPFGHPSQVRTQVLVLETCVDLRRFASPFGQHFTLPTPCDKPCLFSAGQVQRIGSHAVVLPYMEVVNYYKHTARYLIHFMMLSITQKVNSNTLSLFSFMKRSVQEAVRICIIINSVSLRFERTTESFENGN